jgi:hypothetical protein
MVMPEKGLVVVVAGASRGYGTLYRPDVGLEPAALAAHAPARAPKGVATGVTALAPSAAAMRRLFA